MSRNVERLDMQVLTGIGVAILLGGAGGYFWQANPLWLTFAMFGAVLGIAGAVGWWRARER